MRSPGTIGTAPQKDMSAYDEHQRAAGGIVARCAVVTLSDTRTPDTDKSGARIRELVEANGHAVADYQLIPDDAEQLGALLGALLARADVDVILTNGGTGVSRRDTTVLTIERLIEIPLPGFGELFRMLSWEQIGTGAMLSRAVGGVARGKVIFAMPGSTKAVELAMSKLILPEVRHVLRELRK
jgi:molybdopterin adenylyltransferase